MTFLGSSSQPGVRRHVLPGGGPSSGDLPRRRSSEVDVEETDGRDGEHSGAPIASGCRSQDVQAPRSQDIQAPRSQGVQAPRSVELKQAATLVKEADAACKAGNSSLATVKANAAMELLNK